jgi:hypothetical protein
MMKEGELQEVTILGDSIFHYSNKDVYRITSAMGKGSYNSVQMLGKVPGIS